MVGLHDQQAPLEALAEEARDVERRVADLAQAAGMFLRGLGQGLRELEAQRLLVDLGVRELGQQVDEVELGHLAHGHRLVPQGCRQHLVEELRDRQ